MRNYITLTMLLLPLVYAFGATELEKIDYIETYKSMAVTESLRSNIPVSIILAQGLLESDAGKSELAMASLNHFGIKCKSNWTGNSYYKTDDDRDENGILIASCFRSYASIEASYQDHSNFLIKGDRYNSLFTLDKTDYVNWAIGLQQCGYATNQQYALKLIDIIEKYNLNTLDIQNHNPFVKKDKPTSPQQQIVEPPRTPKQEVAIPPAIYIGENYQRGQHDTKMIEKHAPQINTETKDFYTHTGKHTHYFKTEEPLPPVTSSKYSNTMRTVYLKHLQTLPYVPKANNARR